MGNVKFHLSYGRGIITVSIPEKNVGRYVLPKDSSIHEKTEIPAEEMINKALDKPFGEKLEKLSENRHVCVLVDDYTRNEPRHALIPACTARLSKAGLVSFIIATGSHEDNEGNSEIKQIIEDSVRKSKIRDHSVEVHNCHKGSWAYKGKTTRGTEIEVNGNTENVDLFVVLSDLKHHYFAGYANPLKDFVPGICSFKTIEQNHSLAILEAATFGRHPMHPNPNYRHNPVAEDMLEGTEMILGNRPWFVVSVISNRGRVNWCGAGRVESVLPRGFDMLDKLASFKVKPTKYAIVSPGGYPSDESLYNSQRGLELMKNAMVPGGEVLFIAECRNGIGPRASYQHFYDKLTQPLPNVLESIEGKYKLYSHKAYKFAKMMLELNKIHVHTLLDKEVVEKVHLEFAPDPQEVVDTWLKKDPKAKINIFDRANRLVVYGK